MKLRYKIAIGALSAYIILAIAVFPFMKSYATSERGYEAIGGEYCIPMTIPIAVMFIIEAIKEGRKDERACADKDYS